MHELRKAAAQEALAAGHYIRVAACNAWFDPHLRDERFVSLAKIFEDLQLDAVCVQEIPIETSQTHLQHLTDGTGLHVAAYAEGSTTGNAVLLRDGGEAEPPILSRGSLHGGGTFTAVYPVVRWEKHGHTIRSCSVHQPWGGLHEPLRLRFARNIENGFAGRERCDVEYIAGDFNAEAGSASLQYLTGTGPDGYHVAQWTDAWVHAGEGDGYTSSPENPYAQIVGKRHLFTDPRMLPQRRIDYILTRGYTHGQAGTALRCFVHREGFDGAPYPSDHWLLVADLYTPARL